MYSSRMFLAAALLTPAVPALAAPIACDLSGTTPAQGLTARIDDDVLEVVWAADPGQEGRLRFAIASGTPIVRALSLRAGGADWVDVVRNATPDLAITTGLRRMSNQQLRPLNDLKVPMTQAELDKHRWDPFWDAPLDPATAPNPNTGNPPPRAGIPGTDQPGLPRDTAEVAHARATYAVTGCQVRVDGGRIEVAFPGVTLGLFAGRLVYTVYRGSNLVRQELLATTGRNWVAYKYNAGLAGLRLDAGSRMGWRDTANTWQHRRFGGEASAEPIAVRGANRLIVAQPGADGAVAAFPPPHHFWAREVAINMGYNYYRKDAADRFSFGIRQNDKEDDSENPANWALYSGRPGTEQSMPVYFYPSLKGMEGAAAGALAFTRGDTYKPVAGYKVMNHHYHMDLGMRWREDGLGTTLPDLEALKAIGLDIISPIWSFNMVGFDGADPKTVEQDASAAAAKTTRGGDYVELQSIANAGAKLHSDRDFLIMPDVEIYGGPLGGHTDLLFSRPVLWDQRKPGQPFRETDPKFGKVYHVGSAADLMAMARAEDIMITMPHPRTKGSTGYPDVVKDRDYFNDPHYVGVGFRWGMGIDGSERRMCEYRCLPLLDDLSNWMADRREPLKYVNSISEVRHQSPGDDIYGSAPVTYVKLAEQPQDPAPVVAALMRGDSYVTTGEVLLSNFQVSEAGRTGTVSVDVEWTFPLQMVELVWGDGKTVGRQVIRTTDLPPFGSKRFELPFDPTGKKWIRFAAWDTAFEGAFTQPQRLRAAQSLPGRRSRR